MNEEIIQQIIQLVAGGGEAGIKVLLVHLIIGPVFSFMKVGMFIGLVYALATRIMAVIVMHSKAITICRYIAGKSGIANYLYDDSKDWDRLGAKVRSMKWRG